MLLTKLKGKTPGWERLTRTEEDN